MDRLFTSIANCASDFFGRPVAFILAVTFIIVWALTGPAFGYLDAWQLVVNTSTSIMTFPIVVLIQNSQNRDALLPACAAKGCRVDSTCCALQLVAVGK